MPYQPCMTIIIALLYEQLGLQRTVPGLYAVVALQPPLGSSQRCRPQNIAVVGDQLLAEVAPVLDELLQQFRWTGYL